jgi:hypothetical protein
MPDQAQFEQQAKKWFEGYWGFVVGIAIPLIAVLGVYAQLQISDVRQMDAIMADVKEHKNLEDKITLFMNGDFKDQTARVDDNTKAINDLRVEIGKLETLIAERIPIKK